MLVGPPKAKDISAVKPGRNAECTGATMGATQAAAGSMLDAFHIRTRTQPHFDHRSMK